MSRGRQKHGQRWVPCKEAHVNLLNLVDLGFGFQIICSTVIVRGFQFQVYRVDDMGVSVIDSEACKYKLHVFSCY